MRFGEALAHLQDNSDGAITRSDWYQSEAKPIVKLQTPDENSKMTEPYLYMVKLKYGNVNERVAFPLDLSCESILSDKWEIVA